MADGTVGLMFEIAADPSKALAALEGFRDRATEMLASIGGGPGDGAPSAGLGQQTQQIDAQTRSMAGATVPLVTQSMAQMETAETRQIGVLQQLAAGFGQLDLATDRAFSHMIRAHQSYETAALESSQKITLALLQQADAGQKVSASSVASAAAQATGVIKNIKAQAAIKAVFEAAEAVAAFASWDFESGALHLLASAEFAAVAATSAGGGAAGGSGSGSLSKSSVQSRASGGYGGAVAGVGYGSHGSTATTASESVGGGAAMAQGSQPPLPNSEPLHLIVIGPSQQTRFFAQQMQNAVAAGHFVPSSNTRRPAPAVRSG